MPLPAQKFAVLRVERGQAAVWISLDPAMTLGQLRGEHQAHPPVELNNT